LAMTSKHPPFAQLVAHRAGKLPSAEGEEVDFHLAMCVGCYNLFHSLAKSGGTMTSREDTTKPTIDLGIDQAPIELLDHPRYRILQRIGMGTMGHVYLAEHKLMDRRVAIKVIRQSLLDHPDTILRFLGEVKTAAKLDHPNIVRAHDAEQLGNTHMFVMEYVDGESLDVIVPRNGPLPIHHACTYIRATALALQHAHEAGTVHRDVKPANLMVTRQGEVKLGDFGLAKIAREHTISHSATAHATLLGTPDYLAPEQAENAKAADIRADIYSLGCTFHYLLTGRPPYQADSIINLVMMHHLEPPPRVARLRADVPPQIDDLITWMMAKDRNVRPQIPQIVADYLAPFAAGSRVGGSAVAAPKLAAVTVATRLAGPIAAMPVAPMPLPAPAPAPKPQPVKKSLPKPNESVAASLEDAMATRMPQAGIPRPTGKKSSSTGTPQRRVDNVDLVDDDEDLAPRKRSKKRDNPKPEKIATWLMWMMAFTASVTLIVVALILFDTSTSQPFTKKIPAPAGGVVENANGDRNVGVNANVNNPPQVANAGVGGVAVAPAGPAMGLAPLWNRADTNEWLTHPAQPGNWTVANGTLIGRAVPDVTHFYTSRADYRNFHLKMNVRVVEGEFAVIWSAEYGPKLPRVAPTRPEGIVVVFDAVAGASPRVNDIRTVIPANEWVELELIAENNTIRTQVNGQAMATLETSLSRGHIAFALSRANSHVEWRSIEGMSLEGNAAANPQVNPQVNPQANLQPDAPPAERRPQAREARPFTAPAVPDRN
jgi:serine/threonine protein kinase